MRLRGRKGIVEELESQPDLVVLNPMPYKGHWAQVFGNDQPIHLELGMGKGQFISQLSVQHAQINFIGLDKYDELVRRAAEKARFMHQNTNEKTSIDNLKLLRFNIEDIDQVFEVDEITRIYLNFSDPWPKKRHHSRRLTHPRFLEKFSIILKNHAEIHLKTDSSILFEYSLNMMSNAGFQLKNISFDLHTSEYAHNQVLTEYEQKFISRGQAIYRCEAVNKK